MQRKGAFEMWKQTPYLKDLSTLEQVGVQPAKLAGMYQILSSVVEVLFAGRINEKLYNDLRERIMDRDMKQKPGRYSLITIMDEREYENFVGLSIKTHYSSGRYEEDTIDVSCIYTTDLDFNSDMIPESFTLEEFNEVCHGTGLEVFNKNEVYFLRSITKERERRNSYLYEEYLFYIPKRFMLRYV